MSPDPGFPSWPGFVSAIHVFLADAKDVDVRHKAGHDEAVSYKNVIASEAKQRKSPSFRDGALAPDLRCAIAHRGISRFRVRCFASPRNDDALISLLDLARIHLDGRIEQFRRERGF